MSWVCPAKTKRVLEVMGGRGGWHTDALVMATGLTVPEVSVALYELELARRVHRDWTGHYAPINRRPWPEALGASSLLVNGPNWGLWPDCTVSRSGARPRWGLRLARADRALSITEQSTRCGRWRAGPQMARARTTRESPRYRAADHQPSPWPIALP